VSGTCKRETAEDHAKVLLTTLHAIDGQKSLTNLRIVSIASDGEAKRGKALAQLTFKHKLNKESDVFDLLDPLEFMDLYVGDDDITADKDYKHIPKRLRNLFVREKGLLVHGIYLTPGIIKAHFRDNGLSSSHIHAAFNPEDKQDVKISYNMLKDIWSLPPPLPEKPFGFTAARTSLQILGDFCFHLFFPYVCVDLSLSEQLEHLSAAAHLGMALFIDSAAGKAFLPTPLYIDIMIMIKNVFFCVAKAKVDDPDGSFWIILLGTDRLETLFGIMRTTVGNDANLDLLQLVLRLTGCTEIANILAKFPHWQKTPRRLKLPMVSRDLKEVPDQADHINPRSWRGDVSNKHASLLTSWRCGRKIIEDKYPFASTILEAAGCNLDVSVLAPFGSLLVNKALDDDDNEDEDEPSTNPDPDSGTGLCAVEDAAAEAIAQVQGNVIERSIQLSGKVVNKARALAAWFRNQGTPSSTDRLKRVQEVSRYNPVPEADVLDVDSGSGRPSLGVSEPIASLLRCEAGLFLCIGLVNRISIDRKGVEQVDLTHLGEKTVQISFQLLRLFPALRDDDP
jgi:hypothetical protein